MSVIKMVTKCYTAFKVVSFGLMVRLNKLDVLFCHRSGSTRVTHERRSATKLIDSIPGRGGGVLPYMGYIGMCGTKGYVFAAVLVINSRGINLS